MSILVDTNILYSLADTDSPMHAVLRRYVAGTNETLLVPVTVLPEIDYLLVQRFGVHTTIRLYRSIAAGEFILQHLRDEDVSRAFALVEQYADSNIGFVDASIVAIAERLGVTRILTLDRRHFGVIRPRHCDAFTLLP